MNDYENKLNELGIYFIKAEHPDLRTPTEVQNYLGLTLSDGLSTMIMKTDSEFVAIIRRDDCRLDFGKLKKILKSKNIRMADNEEFVKVTGMPIGAARVYNPNLKTFLDNKLFEKELLTGGTGGFTCSFRYRSEDLKKIPDSKVVDITEDVSRNNKIVFSGIQLSGYEAVGDCHL